MDYTPYSREWFNPSRVGSIEVLYDTDAEINMALYLVRARPRKDLLENLHEELSSGKISRMKPFGQALQYALENAGIHIQNTEFVLWIEEDYCSPPLAMERDITMERIESEEEGWKMLHDKPRLWSKR
ncbi:MAG: hypothetical protein WBZ36_13995 [Candidatus Nitrosopolaris sp.]